MSFSPFMYYGDTGRFYIAADDEGHVTAAHALAGNGLWCQWGDDEPIGYVARAWHKPGRYSARSAGWPHTPPAFTCDDYTSAREAASALAEWWDDCRAAAADDEGGTD